MCRFREELLAGASREVAHTMATAGRAITFSGLTVAVGLSSLVLFQGGFTAVGISAAMVEAVAVLYGLTLLPATLAVLGSGVNRLHLPWQHVANGRGFWHSTATAVMRRPLVFLVPCVAVLVAAGTPFVHLRLASAGADSLPPHNQARQGYDTLVRDFTGYGSSEIDVVAYFPGSTPPAVAVDALSQRLASIPGVVGVDAPITGSHVSLLIARSNQDPSGDGARDIVRTIRTQPSLPGGGQVLVTGQTASDLDLIGFLGSHAPLGLAFVLAITCVVLFLMTGSVVLPLKAVMTNLLSISASFGALVWIFEQGHLSRLLDFTPQSVDPNMPIIMFALIFGLSMDYEVLLLARIQERWQATGDSTRAVAEGLERSGRLITGAAAIMIGVFAGWGLADVVLLKALGIGIAIAIGIDATVVRALVVPAIMRLLGARNSWAPWPLARWQSHARPEPAQLPS